MVTYEVLSGKKPFSRIPDHLVVVKVHKGERPGRPRGAIGEWFMNEVWDVLESCWKHTPHDRPGIGDVLQCLENASRSWIPTPQEPIQLLFDHKHWLVHHHILGLALALTSSYIRWYLHTLYYK